MTSSAPPEPASGRSRKRPSPLRRAAGLSWRDWADTAVATLWLARARWIHRRTPAAELLRTVRQAGPDGTDTALALRLATAIPRAAAHVPWRSDCFVQAIAAREWLAARGVGSALYLGVYKDGISGFAAHAWLRHGDITVTGGDFSKYSPIVAPHRRAGPGTATGPAATGHEA